MKIAESPLCTFCKSLPESIFHLFCECENVQDLWNTSVETLISQKTGQIIPFTSWNIIFGITSTHIDFKTINIIIVIGKYHIYKQKLRNILLNVNGFRLELENYIKIEELIFRKKL